MVLSKEKRKFIEDIAKLVQKYAPAYGIKVHSPIIAQAILESGWGESGLAVKYHNYFGLKCGTKWTGKSVNMKTQEEYTAGTLTTICDNFRAYGNMDEGVKGYFEFIQLARYQNLKGITDPRKYLETIKADGYATSSSYVENTYKCVTTYNLTQYDKQEKEKSTTKAEKATQQMESWARDDSHGYDQIYRWGEKGDYDCSAAVIQAYENAGVPVKSKGATYTGNMLGIFKACGFEDVTNRVNRATGAGLLRGDVLLNTAHHTAIYCGNGKEVEASINENGTATGGKPGDQTGKEFLIRSYRNYPWTNILRYTGGETVAAGTVDTSKGYLSMGDIGSAVKAMQTMLIACGYSCGSAGADGDFGSGTNSGLRSFQKANGLTVDGKYGSKSKNKLEELYSKKTGSAKKSVDELAQEVITGKWGTGDARKSALKKAGHDYDAVQKRVNEILSASTPKKSVTKIAKEVIAGKWGVGNDRKKRLEAAGYDYAKVQKKVNELLK